MAMTLLLSTAISVTGALLPHEYLPAVHAFAQHLPDVGTSGGGPLAGWV